MLVNLYNSTNCTFANLESEYGISAGTIQRWIKQLTPIKASTDETMTIGEIKKIKKEMIKLQEENEILKKAMAILAKKQQL